MKALIFAAMLTLPVAAFAQDSTQAPRPQGNPLRGVVRVGNVLYLSGQVGSVPGTRQMAEGGIKGQVRQTLENIKRVVEREGSSMSRVAKCIVFLTDMAYFQAMNEVYRTFFPTDPPARSTIGVAALARPDVKVEIECIAEVNQPK